MAENNFATEVKENGFYILGKKVMSFMGDIGAGAIAGAAAAMVPTNGMKPWQKFCVGVGVYGIGRWVAQQSSTAIETSMDGTVDAICMMIDPIKQMAAACEKVEKEDEEKSDDKVVEFQAKEE